MSKNKRYSDLKVKKRDTEKYPALKKNLNLKSRQDEIEVDYLHKLNDKEKEWLNKFNEEYVNATLDREDFNNNIHNTLELKQDCDHRNYKRRDDLYVRQKAREHLAYLDDDSSKKFKIDNYEDKLITKIEQTEE